MGKLLSHLSFAAQLKRVIQALLLLRSLSVLLFRFSTEARKNLICHQVMNDLQTTKAESKASTVGVSSADL